MPVTRAFLEPVGHGPMKQRLAAVVAACLLGAVSSLAQTAPSSRNESAPEVPDGDIFGFTEPTDVGNPGEKSLALETTTRIGKARGLYVSPELKTELSVTPAANLALFASTFVSAHRIRGVPGLDDRAAVRFDGFSSEIQYRFLERSPGNPLAATIGIEPRLSRVDEITGERARAYEAEFKLLLDAVLVPNRLYGAMNLTYAAQLQRSAADVEPSSEASSETSLSGALAYQASDRLFLGAEARWLTSFSGAALNQLDGQALFAGPTLLVKLSEEAALNLSWTPQVIGRSQENAGRRLDLDNFERHQLRVKFETSF